MPRRLSTISTRRAFFGAKGDVLFAGAEGETEIFIYRISQDGTGLRKAIPNPVNYAYDVSPGGNAIAVWSGGPVQVYLTDGGSHTTVSTMCGAAGGENRGTTPPCVSWSADGKFLYTNGREVDQVYAFPLQPGRILPPVPPTGIRSAEEALAVPGVRVIREPTAFVGANPSVYAFFKVAAQSNIYRISVP